MKVLHLINTAEVGGGGEHLVALVHALRARGFTSHVAVGRDGPAAGRLRETGVPVSVLGPLRATAPFKVASVMRAARPDLVHLHGSRAGLAGTFAARMAGVRPTVYTAHAFSFKRRLPPPVVAMLVLAERLTCRSADQVICLTHSDRHAAAARGIDTRHVTVIPNGIEVARFAAARDRRDTFGFAPGAPIVGMVARLVPDKDPIAFVDLAHEITQVMPSARFVLVGDGPLRAEVQRAVRRFHLEEVMRLTGLRDDVPDLLLTFDVVVLTSRWEGLPLVVLEAMASGKPVVARALPGLDEVVIDGETGLLVPPQDPHRLTEAVTTLLRDPQRRTMMGRRARARVDREFSVQRMVAATVNVYHDALRAAAPATIPV